MNLFIQPMTIYGLYGFPEFLPELTRALTGQLDMSSMDGLEDLMSEPFVDPCASRRWREGTLKTSFNYLLLDPRVSQNLPARHRAMGECGMGLLLPSLPSSHPNSSLLLT